ncbi:MAG: aminodeoxychorismate synthase component I [Flavobacteriaceae bacterium]|nr:aminodeoxychorismate synthase component I [Flavobacteriaceae bacterium]
MKRSFTRFSHPNIEQLKLQLLHWSKRYSTTVLLDSNDYAHQETDYDFILATDPFSVVQSQSHHAFTDLQTHLHSHSDWLFGYLSYDLKNDLENLQSQNLDHLDFPELFFFQPKRLWIIKGSQVEAHYLFPYQPNDDWEQIISTPDRYEVSIEKEVFMHHRITKADYLAKTQALQQHIARGDIYEVNFCMELYAEDTKIEPHTLFQELNERAKSPFAAFVQIGDRYLLGSSPERFLKRVGDRLISQPIKGTAKRHIDMVQDATEASQLQKNEKERAENTMIVDLVRNDMSRIAAKGSVQVEELCKVYPFAHVHQMISTVVAELQTETQVSDVIAACFPMGSMTGAPKLRAMQLIEQYEETKRGLYSGAVGYIDPNGDFDFNVVIRSLLYRKDTRYLSLQVGSALTANSNPEKEYEECLLKAKGALEVLSKKMTINL